ncbi:tetratricopeptide repeat protein [Sandarakinorhabdus rubra]|uniref:tetratricopeptide repeat protein n=1 Tax=Sandarakinorhabdus rubra TaxID=2672568 RepID=UPI0013D99B1E|nr:tetratricopeptide repeat protein [Sandarakinorhabdus rubra]
MANTPAKPDDTFLREVDEEYRRSQLAGLWQRFGRWMIAALVLALAGLAGFLYWQDRKAAAAGEAGAALARAIEQLEVGEGARARPALEAMTRDGAPVYAGLARMVLANDALAGGDKAKARGLYEAVARDAALPQPIRDAALVKAVRIGFDQLPPAEVVARLKPLAVPGNGWFGVAGELVAVAHIKAGKPEAARPILIALVKDETLSPSLRARAAQLAVAVGVDPATLGLGQQPGTQAGAQ